MFVFDDLIEWNIRVDHSEAIIPAHLNGLLLMFWWLGGWFTFGVLDVMSQLIHIFKNN